MQHNRTIGTDAAACSTPWIGRIVMARILGLVVAGGLLLGAASESKAQLALSIGNPYYGGTYIGSGYGYPAYGYSSGFGYPGYSYSSGYAGYAPLGYGYGVPAYSGV